MGRNFIKPIQDHLNASIQQVQFVGRCMTDILIPHYPQASSEDWMMFEWVLPHGYRHVASVQRPSPDGNVMSGEIYDLGQNAEGLFRLFRRGTGEFANSHVGNGEPLSDTDVAGFGLTREQCPEDLWQEDGEYSSLCKTHLIVNH